jgi:hypothetical protein
VVAGLYVCDALTNGLDDTSTLVPEDDGESTLGVLAGECVGICVADTSVVDFNADLVGPGGCNLNILNGEVLAGFPGNCGLFSSVQLSPQLDSSSACWLSASSAAQCLSTVRIRKRQALYAVTEGGQRSAARDTMLSLQKKELQNAPCR